MNTFLFAIDGASPHLVNRWIEEGELPNLGQIKKRGLSGELKSTFPPLTGPAWSSFQTGVNPGKHGVFNWLDLNGSYKGSVINSTSIKTKTVWEFISSSGGEIGLLSLPVTFPPQEVNGFIMPGFLTPKKSPRRSYPRELAGKIESSIPGYNNYVDEYMGGSEKNWVNYLKQTAHNRGKASRYLVKEHLTQLSPETENSLFLVHFFATDLVQHFLWDRASDEWDPRLEVFRAVDEEVGKLMEIAPERSSFLVASDHGFGPVERIFNVNNWLRKEGYLKLSGSPRTEFKKILSRSGLNQHRLKPLGEKIYPIVKGLGLAPGNIISASSHPLLKTCFLSERDVDWKDTVAYSKSDVGHIRLNLIGREREGAVTERQGREVIEEIKLKLEDLKVPSADTGLVEWVKPKEDLYWGPYLKDAPDLLFNSLDRKDRKSVV